MNTRTIRHATTPTRRKLITDHVLARRLHVGDSTVRLWIASGAWPLPRYARGASLLYDPADVECWLATGRWPAGSRFRTGP